jgi:hypothetical protein
VVVRLYRRDEKVDASMPQCVHHRKHLLLGPARRLRCLRRLRRPGLVRRARLASELVSPSNTTVRTQ